MEEETTRLDDALDPIAQAELLVDEEPPPGLLGAGNDVYSVKVSNVGGRATLEWTTSAIGRWDWVGLYDGPSGSWKKYKRGQWQWVRDYRGGAYKTRTKYKKGLQARYVIWDYGLKSYRVVATS